jgi:hypothetical protein
MLTAVCSLNGRKKPKPHYTFILPDGYIGWVEVIFSDPGALPLPVRLDSGRRIDVPESGTPRTSNMHVIDSRAKDEFYDRFVLPSGEGALRPVPAAYVLPDSSHGGFSMAGTCEHLTDGGSWYLGHRKSERWYQRQTGTQ